MSEKPPATPAIPVNQAFDPQERQAQKELNAYIESRPYEDGKGNLHDPSKGSFINSDKYFDGQRDAAMDEGQTAYESMPNTVLAKKLAEAEFNEDRTTATNIEDVMLDKAAAQDEKESERNPERDGKESDELLDHLTGIKETELQKRIEESLEPGEDSAEDKESKVPYTSVYYEPNDEGNATTAVEITNEGEAFNLPLLKGSRALLTTGDTTYYIHGNHVDDLMKLRNGKEGESHGWDVNDTDRLPEVKIGEPLTIHGKQQEGAIKKIEILLGETLAESLDDKWEARGKDPFAQADALLKEKLGPEAEAEADTDVIDAVEGVEGVNGSGDHEGALLFETGGIRQRIRNAMANAAAAIHVRMLNAQEYMTDKENGRRRRIVAGGVVGALAIGGGYLAAKGISIDGPHGSEAVPALTIKPHHQETMHSALGNDGTTAPAAHAIELKPGQNPWEVSEHRLHGLGIAHPTNAQIEDYDKLMAHENPGVYAYGGDSSEHLAVGTKLKLPR